MASLKADLFKISKGMGVRNGIELIFLPRVLVRLGFKSFYSESKVAERFISQNLKDVISKYVNVECSNANTLQTPNIIWIFWWRKQKKLCVNICPMACSLILWRIGLAIANIAKQIW